MAGTKSIQEFCRRRTVQLLQEGESKEVIGRVLGVSRQTSAPVAAINHKARVILKRAYGLKSADSLWTRLMLDLTRAKEVVVLTIGQFQEIAAGFRLCGGRRA
jgi:hypothetical protein